MTTVLITLATMVGAVIALAVVGAVLTAVSAAFSR